MKLEDQLANRRKHIRFPLNYCTLTADLKIARIVDISHGGMSFYYADREAWPKNACQQGTLKYREKSFAIDLPIETVSDIEMPNNYTNGSMTVRRRSVRFGELTETQIEQLDKVISTASSL
ncbi:MAG: PilZ domain-containing protein [Desulfobulbaceae bacterium]|nr:PilZ domain-containing protein [Desulfobulbaceae bacterium]